MILLFYVIWNTKLPDFSEEGNHADNIYIQLIIYIYIYIIYIRIIYGIYDLGMHLQVQSVIGSGAIDHQRLSGSHGCFKCLVIS